MGKPKKIYCPLCGRKVMTYDGRAHNNLSVRCESCDRLVTFYFETGRVQTSRVPERQVASGVRFY